MILADTSAWVEYDRASGSAVDLRVTELIETEGSLCVTEPVVMEVLAGARSDQREADLRRLLHRFTLLPYDSITDFDASTGVYRRCRRSGLTRRGLSDCMVDGSSTRWSGRCGAGGGARDSASGRCVLHPPRPGAAIAGR